eukprot:g32907.t1
MTQHLSEAEMKRMTTLYREQFVSSGAKQSVQEFLGSQLAGSPWEQELRQACRAELRARGGAASAQEVTRDLAARSKGSVPSLVQKEARQLVWRWLFETSYSNISEDPALCGYSGSSSVLLIIIRVESLSP